MSRGFPVGPEVTILHISDLQFGTFHRFYGQDPSMAELLLSDLRQLAGEIPRIDLIILSGDMVESGLMSEFDQARAFIDGLLLETGLDSDRVVVVPGNHDVNADLSKSYFAECRAEEKVPRMPYARKWRHYQKFVDSLHGAAAFTEEQPYRVQRFGDLRIVVAALNSTMRESHRDEEHYGWCGNEQLRWMESQLADADGCVRLGVVHHNVSQQAATDTENLHDSANLTSIVGHRLDLLLHGHAHNAREGRLTDGTLVLTTGSAALTVKWRPGDVPTQYQILRLRSADITRWARRWDPAAPQWVADKGISQDGRHWRVTIPFAPVGWQWHTRAAAPLTPSDGPPGGNEFVSQVEYVTRRDLGTDCSIDRRRMGERRLDYLIAVRPAAPLRCVGVVDGPLTVDILDQFDETVFGPLRERGGTELVLVHHGPQIPKLRRQAERRGIRVKTWTEYNDLLDASAYRMWLQSELDHDDLYPQDLYLPQRFQNIDRWGHAGPASREDLLGHIYDRIWEEEGRFFLVLGDAGFGKSFLVRRLAHQMLANPDGGVTPIVIYLRDRDKRQTIEEMVDNVLIHSRSPFNSDRFRHSLEAGTIALLIDGYDEFAVRVGYRNAAEQLQTFIRAQQGRAKILLTTRPNHFRSTDQATTALFESLRSVHQGTVFQLEPFSPQQQHAFLVRWFELRGNPAAANREADRWMNALSRVDNLPELARTPRMLSFMVQDLSLTDIESAASVRTVTAATLYQSLIDLWLRGEADKVNPLDERNVPPEKRQFLLEEIAFHLWRIGERDVTEEALQESARASLDLPRIDMTVDQAAQLIGGRTLLKVDARRWRFAHQSVWEFLLASCLAGRLRAGEDLEQLGDAQLTQLTIRFLRDLAPAESTAWAARTSGTAR